MVQLNWVSLDIFSWRRLQSKLEALFIQSRSVRQQSSTAAMTKTTVAGVQYLRNSTSSYTLPVFLVPALVHYPLINSASQVRSTSCLLPYCNIRAFSTTPCPQKRPVDREKNKSRGVSAIRRTGPRVPLPIAKYVLPRPVLDPPARKQFKTNPKHGLWGFFNADKTAMSSPEQELAHGRSWTYAELDYKSFEDLHNLYWVCVKEKNRIATAQRERHRVFAGYGDYEAQSRDQAVSLAIFKYVLPSISSY